MADVMPDDANAIRGTIQAQLEAFAADDAPLAFSFASPPIQEMFRTPAVFIDMVRLHYAAVYRPVGVRFGEAIDYTWGVVQVVHFRVPTGEEIPAHYELVRLDGRWRITGCVLG